MADHFELTIKILASISALYMCLSPSSALHKIHKQRSTGQTSIIPLVALWVCDHMWYVRQHARLKIDRYTLAYFGALCL